MNFTKEYIELCRNPKIQGLRKELEKEDFIISEYELIRRIYPDYIIKRDDFTWLPTSEQLDNEILNVCRKKFNDNFQYEIGFITSKWYGTIAYWKEYEEYMKDSELMRYATEINEDPLICKLRLLITLLREK